MIRAAVLIGVADTGGYPHLEAVGKGCGDVRKWIDEQGDFGDRVEVLTDLDGQPVTVAKIKAAISGFAKLGTVEQLLIYFAGHGMNLGYQELWLLSEAPDDPNAAVNLAGSVVLARHCGIPHVIFISDACRSAADSITAHAIGGSVIFPNRGPRSAPGVVDVFYATAVGDPALEVRPRDSAAKEYHAIYTTALVSGLNGTQTSIIEPIERTDRGLIRPWPLQRYLSGAVTGLLRIAGLHLTESQVPDAIISSPPESWLSTVKAPPPTRSGLGFKPPKAPQDTPSSLSVRAVTLAISGLAGDRDAFDKTLEGVRGDQESEGAGETPALPAGSGLEAGSLHFATDCGFVVSGMRLRQAHIRQAGARIVGEEGTRLEVGLSQKLPANVLLVFENGKGALLPAIPDYVGTLEFDAEQRLMSVSYEPAADTLLRKSVEPEIPAVAELRRVIAAAARLGTFRLTRDSADELISRMRNSKYIDPCLAVYAAHALADLNRTGDIADMEKYLWKDLRFSLFDVALLKGTPSEEAAPMPPGVYPAVPLLTQTWPLLEAYGIRLPEGLGATRQHLTNSLWTLFNPGGVALLRHAITSGVI